ncbi:MAG: CocE/NonD family hydrolase, partial [Thermoleophilia bacterium]|nr:CocE/NonD family hydrolase [Thermoleophilia bacterium]
HGSWGWGTGNQLGNLEFAVSTGEIFRKEIQFPFFMHHLKGKQHELPEAMMFLTGINEFRRLDAWPPPSAAAKTFFLSGSGRLREEPAADLPGEYDEFVSDPERPVPYVNTIVRGMTSDYMTEDQRFAAQRPDVLVYRTEPLAEDLIVAGPIAVRLSVSTTGTDADFVVKLIDVYPDSYPTPEPAKNEGVRPVPMGGYQQLVRGEPFRGKYRNSSEHPEPFVPGAPTTISFEMPDVYHAFRKGHSIMVHIQSSWFPLVDRNPRRFMEIPKARKTDFQKATHRVYRSKDLPSTLTVLVEPR